MPGESLRSTRERSTQAADVHDDARSRPAEYHSEGALFGLWILNPAKAGPLAADQARQSPYRDRMVGLLSSHSYHEVRLC